MPSWPAPWARPAGAVCSISTAGRRSRRAWKSCIKASGPDGSFVLDDITPLIITYNEASNIRRTLDKLLWARRIVVVDSGSTDETLDILRGYPQVDVVHHPFTDFANQCNYGISLVRTPWVL